MQDTPNTEKVPKIQIRHIETKAEEIKKTLEYLNDDIHIIKSIFLSGVVYSEVLPGIFKKFIVTRESKFVLKTENHCIEGSVEEVVKEAKAFTKNLRNVLSVLFRTFNKYKRRTPRSSYKNNN